MQEKNGLDVSSSLPHYLLATDSIIAGLRAAPITVCSTVEISTVTATSIALRY
jgi:hypothetical protein